MTELAADYIKDQAGIWWLIGIKGFKLEESYVKPTFKSFIPAHEVVLDEDANY